MSLCQGFWARLPTDCVSKLINRSTSDVYIPAKWNTFVNKLAPSRQSYHANPQRTITDFEIRPCMFREVETSFDELKNYPELDAPMESQTGSLNQTSLHLQEAKSSGVEEDTIST